MTFVKKLVEFFKKRLKGTNVEKEFPEGFLHDLYLKTALEKKALRFTYSRLNSLLRTLEVTSLEEFTPLQVRQARPAHTWALFDSCLQCEVYPAI